MSRHQSRFGSILAGCLVVLAVNCCLWGISLLVVASGVGWFYYRAPNDGGISTFYLLYPGVAQLVYVVPALYFLAVREKGHLMQGILLGAILTGLINGGVWLSLGVLD